MAEPRMPAEMMAWMGARMWGQHHLEWHVVRQWDRGAGQFARQQGWSRADAQEGEPRNGLDFLVMHRAMIELLREQFPRASALLAGWVQVPIDPNDRIDPVPAGNPARTFAGPMLTAVRQLHDEAFLRSLDDDDAFGLYVETSFRPVTGRPNAQSSDPTTGLHNYLHGRFQVTGDPVDLGDIVKNLGNQRFWRIHGWIDSRWTAFRRAKGLPGVDASLIDLIRSHKMHMGHAPMQAMRWGPRHEERVASAGAAEGNQRGRVVVEERVASAGAAEGNERRWVQTEERVAAGGLSIENVPFTISHPFVDTVQRRFARVMDSGNGPQTVDDLRSMLQTAVELEWFTMPPYLCAMWSLREAGDVGGILRSVAMEEMLHMAICCNLLVGIGGRPRLASPEVFPEYPDNPPGIALRRPVSLQGFSLDAVRLFMEVEKPAHDPIVIGRAAAPPAATIGDFYQAIIDGFERIKPTLVLEGQAEGPLGLQRYGDHVAAIEALRLVVEQGEGSTTSPESDDGEGELAHYYRFQQIVDGVRYVKQPDGTFRKDPTQAIRVPEAAGIRPVAPVPTGGYRAVPVVERFDEEYTAMVEILEDVWAEGQPDPSTRLWSAVGMMSALTEAAKRVMETPIRGGVGNYAPDFRYRKALAAPHQPGGVPDARRV